VFRRVGVNYFLVRHGALEQHVEFEAVRPTGLR
jgi:hypothetical protein